MRKLKTAMRKSLALLIFISALLFSACSIEQKGYIYFHDGLEYAPSSLEETVEELKQSGKEFTHFATDSKHNLDPLKKENDDYLWVRIPFTVTDSLKDKNIALVIPYLHFCEKSWLNGHFIGEYGAFPPKLKAAQYEAHFYYLPEEYLIDGENEILIKVYTMGFATISGRLFIGEEYACRRIAKTITFIKAKVYFILAGIMLAASILFFLIYFHRKTYRSYFAFALLNALCLLLINPFIGSEIPLYFGDYMPYLTYMKISMYCTIPLAVFTAVEFMLMYVGYFSPIWLFSLRLAAAIIPSIICGVIQDYGLLMKVCRPILIVLICNLSLGLIIPILTVKTDQEEKRLKTLFAGFTPLFCTMFLDFILKILLKDDLLPYFTVFGFQITDLVFFIVLTLEFTHLSIESERLNNELDKEIKKQTQRLSVANKNLETEIRKSNIELEMASVVQHGFLPDQQCVFKNFEFSTIFEPLRNVSGDFYDYYVNNDRLEGFSLFDVSGHGIAASLITLLGKNVVKECFSSGTNRNEKVNQTLKTINVKISKQKGLVENYLTGLLFRIDKKSYNEKKTTITFADAGHPHPILYRAAENDVIELKPDEKQTQFGAVGLFSTDVSFAENTFTMQDGDILVCYTDGLTEAFNKNREQFGLDRLKQLLLDNNKLEAVALQNLIYDELKTFTNHAPKEDDLTFIVLKKSFAAKATVKNEAEEAIEELEMLSDVEELEPIDELEPVNEEEHVEA